MEMLNGLLFVIGVMVAITVTFVLIMSLGE
jgi:hypothetical protein